LLNAAADMSALGGNAMTPLTMASKAHRRSDRVILPVIPALDFALPMPSTYTRLSTGENMVLMGILVVPLFQQLLFRTSCPGHDHNKACWADWHIVGV